LVKAQSTPGDGGEMDASLFTKSRKADYWNDFYENPTTQFEHSMVLRRDFAHREICAHVTKDARILDLGCGAGVLSEKLLASGYRVTSADYSEDMLELTRKRLAAAAAAPEAVVRADILNLPFEDASFDVVICMGVFGYFDDVDRALAEVRRVLKPGGRFFMSIRNTYNLYLSDIGMLPFRLLRFAGKAVWGKLGPRGKPSSPAGSHVARSAAPPEAFRIGVHTDPRPVIDGINQRGFTLTEFDGLGYGPPTLFGVDFLPGKWSMKLNDALDRYFRRSGLQGRTRWLADVSFYTFKRND
jgi:SAM-dependent methyltransferase